jgi:hypothetical protein
VQDETGYVKDETGSARPASEQVKVETD